MQMARVVAARLPHHREEGDDVVAHLGLDRLHALGAQPDVAPEPFADARGHLAPLFAHGGHGQLDLEPAPEPVRVTPQRRHGGPAVACDHGDLPPVAGASTSLIWTLSVRVPRSTTSDTVSPTPAP